MVWAENAVDAGERGAELLAEGPVVEGARVEGGVKVQDELYGFGGDGGPGGDGRAGERGFRGEGRSAGADDAW